MFYTKKRAHLTETEIGVILCILTFIVGVGMGLGAGILISSSRDCTSRSPVVLEQFHK